MRCIRRVQTLLGAEPVLFFYFFWVFMLVPVMSLYIYARISDDKGFPYTNITAGGGCGAYSLDGNSSTLNDLEIEVQTESANLILYYVMSACLPTIIVAPFMGSYTDRGGRKPGMMIPLVGAMTETALILVIMYLNLPLWTIIVGGIINGFTGSITSMLLSVMSYIADSVSSEKLSFRYGMMQFTMFIAATVSQLTSGLWIDNFGYKTPVWFLMGCLCATLVYVIFFLQESRPRAQETGTKESLLTRKTLTRFCKVFTKPRAAGRQNLWKIIFILGVNILATVGTGSAQMLFVLRRPLCWSASIIGYYLSYRFFTFGLGGAVMIPVLKKCLGELNVVRIGYLSQIAALFLFAFSDRTWIVFIVPVVGFLAGVIDPIFFGISSKIVSEEEQGSLFAAVGILSAMGEFLGTTLFNTLYPLSLQFEFPGFVFVLAGGIFVFLAILTLFLDIPSDIAGNSKELVECCDGNSDVIEDRDVTYETKPDVDAQTVLLTTTV